jgi:hypothetical protein
MKTAWTAMRLAIIVLYFLPFFFVMNDALLWVRPFLIVGGFLIAFPGWMPTIYGAVLIGPGIVIALLGRRTAAKPTNVV